MLLGRARGLPGVAVMTIWSSLSLLLLLLQRSDLRVIARSPKHFGDGALIWPVIGSARSHHCAHYLHIFAILAC